MKTTTDTHRGLIQLSDVQSEQVEFLWHPLIPNRKITLLEGDPGVGKSWVTLAIATSISLGQGLPGKEPEEPGKVLLLSAEDGLADTIKPRLESFGADCSNIYAPEELFTLDDAGYRSLEKLINECTPRLVVIDPLVAYLGGKVDMNKANETRVITAKLAKLVEENGCAALAVRHLSKSEKKALYRGIGSIDFTAAARSVLLVGCRLNDPSDRAIIHIKSNLAPIGKSIGYVIDEGRFSWADTDMTADDILCESASRPVDTARDFLTEILRDGPVAATTVEEEARKEGIRKRTLDRAKKELTVESKKEQFEGKWAWRLPAC